MTQDTVNILKGELVRQGITNPYVVNGILAHVTTESSNLKTEYSYRNTPASRIREIWPDKFKTFTDQNIDKLKVDDIAFFDFVYGGQYGNINKGDGFKYRGRGFNQLTFKDLYAKYGKMVGVDLVNNPDLLNQESVAARVLAAYFKETLRIAKANGTLKSKIGVNDISEIKTNEQAVRLALQANAGFGKNIETTFFKKVYEKSLAAIKANPVTSSIIVVLVLGALFF